MFNNSSSKLKANENKNINNSISLNGTDDVKLNNTLLQNHCSIHQFTDRNGNNFGENGVVQSKSKISSPDFNEEQETCFQYFDQWLPIEQVEFVENLLRHMCHSQQVHVSNFLKPILKRDFIALMPASIAENILSRLDEKSLHAAGFVSSEWLRVIADGLLWKKLIEKKVNSEPIWHGMSMYHGWSQFLFKNNIHFNKNTNVQEQHKFYKELYLKTENDIKRLEINWSAGKYWKKKINCQSEINKGVYCIQYDYDKIVSGLRDHSIKIWSKKECICTHTLNGHSGSVLCLQYDDKIIVSGSSDNTVRVWDIKTGENLQTLQIHREAVLHLKFLDGLMVTCSKDRQIIVWTMNSPTDIQMKRTLVGHRAAVNVVDFDQRYIVSASGDRTIKIWLTSTCEFLRNLTGHKRGIACLQYKGNLVVSGSSDHSIRIWDVESGECLRVLEGHEELVRCIRFDNKRIVSGAYDGKIKVWDMKAALDARSNTSSLCIQTLTEHTGRVFRLQFDDFKIVSSSHDDTIIIWNFLE